MSKRFAVGPSSSASGSPRESREQRQQRRQAQLEQRQRKQAQELARLLALEQTIANAEVRHLSALCKSLTDPTVVT